MNRIQSWTAMAAAATMVALSATDSMAQATRLRTEGTRTVPSVGGAGGGAVRIRQFTGYGPRAMAKIPDFFPRGRAPARDWAEMQVIFDSDPEWIDELSFQYYALLHDKVTDEYTLLKGLVMNVDVARGKGHMTTAYIRPNTLARLGDVVAVAVEVLYKGEVVANQADGKLPRSQPLPADWWKNPKLPLREGLILSRAQTPFAYVAYDDYEALK